MGNLNELVLCTFLLVLVRMVSVAHLSEISWLTRVAIRVLLAKSLVRCPNVLVRRGFMHCNENGQTKLVKDCIEQHTARLGLTLKSLVQICCRDQDREEEEGREHEEGCRSHDALACQ